MNDFVAANPGVTVVLMGGLITLCSTAISLVFWLGYTHVMRRFDNIDGDEEKNRKEHKDIFSRLVRIETLVINGGNE